MNNLKKLFFSFNYNEYILLLFPIIVVFRSVALNILIVIAGVIFLKNLKQNFNFLKNEKWIFYYIFFISYLILNSFFAEDFFASLKSSASQIRFVMFSLFICFAIQNTNNLKKIFFIHSLILLLVSLDTIYQFYNGKDIFGYMVSNNQINRLSGPFGDELIVGSYLTLLSIPIISYLLGNLKKFKKILKIYIISFLLVVSLAIILSGERIVTLIFLSSLILILFFNLNFKKAITLFIILISLLTAIYFNVNSVNSRVNSFKNELSLLKSNNHIRLFSSAFNIWSENKINGVGLKNFRIKCDQEKFDNFTNLKQLCSSHPHNLYFELLSETGIVGLIIFIIFFYIFFNNYFKEKPKFDETTYPIFFGCLLVILSYLWPIRSNGSFFSTFTGTFFWLNFGYLLLVKRLNKN